jgi:catechol 2,3-dioxygenase-like lactoylglutathione lyase family enzyme
MKAKLAYTGIRVKDLDKSIEFYTKLLDMTLKGRSKIEATKGEVASLVSQDGGHELELNYYPEGNKFATEYVAGEGLDHLAFQVEDLDEAASEFSKAGYPVELELKGASSRWFYVKDPNDIFIEIFA